MSFLQNAVAQDASVPARVAVSHPDVPDACAPALEAILRHARHESRDTMPALLAWWGLLATSGLAERGGLLEQLRQRVRRGEATPRALLPAALGDTDASLVTAATSGYLGAGPVSVEWRAQAIDDALDWIRRGLALNAAGVFVALLRLQDEEVHARLRGLRGRLHPTQRDTVWSCCAADVCPATQLFLADWRAEPA